MGRVKNDGGKPSTKNGKSSAAKGGKPNGRGKKDQKVIFKGTGKQAAKLIKEGAAPFLDFEDTKPKSEKTVKDIREEAERSPRLTLDNLSPKHIHFCRRYAAHGNSMKASREAGFNEWYGGWALKQEPILQTIAKYREQRRKKFDLTADKVIEELCRVAFGNIVDFLDLDAEGTPRVNLTADAGVEEFAFVKEIEQEVYQEKVGFDHDTGPIFEPVKKTKLKFHDKLKALELLGRNLRLWDAAEGGELSVQEKAQRVREILKAMKQADGDI